MFSTIASVALLANVVSSGIILENKDQIEVDIEVDATRFNEYKNLPGHTKFEDYTSPLPHTYTDLESFPDNFHWGDVDGKNYLTKNLNQHIPQYCGSCWAHGALSSLGDRIKIARDAKGIDVNLAVQFILNCGTEVAGSCNGGSHTGTYNFIKNFAGHVPYDTCLQYEACSHDSDEENCKMKDYSCNAANTCRTCSTFTSSGGYCSGLTQYPNATIAEYGHVRGEKEMMAEIYKRGPIACGVDAGPLDKYEGGIIDNDEAKSIDHIISIVGWGTSDEGVPFWHVRNSWGEYWGEMGYFRAVRGRNQLGLEADCAWATPGAFTEVNFPCYEDGGRCHKKSEYVDPSRK
eukprot:Awhi_evm1s3393